MDIRIVKTAIRLSIACVIPFLCLNVMQTKLVLEFAEPSLGKEGLVNTKNNFLVHIPAQYFGCIHRRTLPLYAQGRARGTEVGFVEIVEIVISIFPEFDHLLFKDVDRAES
ncbi:hypothetical protein M413DRAFT_438332 [Hebeloma cylindrosporum]|uniref:Uncharacterized protein n=1 Tax=Hebeloma cylindrosporum TaxID=76867 RepID=A0A0C2Z7S4_HEBCY|nr:hypothetical protein M413DRAFT_438332 [Hebeloma cylindrosporum h7]